MSSSFIEQEKENAEKHVASTQYFNVPFNRAVCIHSSLQFVDLLLQSVMFSHGISSTPVIPQFTENHGSKTQVSFEKIRVELCSIFRSKHRNSVSEVAIVIGMSPVKSAFVYRVPIELCEADDSTHEKCGDTCAQLNDKERRKINMDLFRLRSGHENLNDKNYCAKNHRMFVYVKGCDKMVGEGVEEESDPLFINKTCNQYTFIHQKCNCDGVRSKKIDGKWLRVVPFMVTCKD